MEVKVFAVRVGDKYGEEYEHHLRSKIPQIHFLNEETEGFLRQWNKIHFINLDYDEPIVVGDIDIDLVNNYEEIISYPIKRGEFLSMRAWWENGECDLNGGFYKFYPRDTHYIYDEFKENKSYWEKAFLKVGIKNGPINGEENFVAHMVKKRLKLKHIPDPWVCRMVKEPTKKWLAQINRKYPGDYAMLDMVNPNIKLLHYTML